MYHSKLSFSNMREDLLLIMYTQEYHWIIDGTKLIEKKLNLRSNLVYAALTFFPFV